MDERFCENEIIKIESKLHSYGVSKIELAGLPLKYWGDIEKACGIVNEEFPEIFQSLHSISFGKLGDGYFGCVGICEYDEFKHTKQPLYMKLNESCKRLSEAENNFTKGYYSGFHNIKTFRGHFLHELAHVLEFAMLAKCSFRGEVFKETYDDYLLKAGMHDISKQIYTVALGTNALAECPLDEKKYGNTSFSEFFAETMAEFWELGSVEQYAMDIHSETSQQYKFYYR